MQQLSELSGKKIISPADEATCSGLVQYLQTALLAHSNELLSCWFVMRAEYTPLISGFAALLSRASNTVQRAEIKQEPDARPENVVDLK